MLSLPPRSDLRSFFVAGFECSAHRRADGVRLDLIAATRHDRFVAADYERIVAQGMRTVRDGARWHLIERAPGFYDWSSFLPMLRAARAGGVQPIWDLCHYGYPDRLDIWSARFPERFGRFAKALAQVVRDETDEIPYFCPINEMSYWAWAGGDMRLFNLMARGRGPELKRQLARATIAAIDAVREVEPRARFICAEPSIHVLPNGSEERDVRDAEGYRLSQFECHDMLVGRRDPELGGAPQYLDVVGVNFYPQNQWVLGGGTVPMGHHDYRPFREMLAETAERYGRPVIVSEAGAEGTARPAWLHYVCDEVEAAREEGVPVEALCLYPILDYPGWDNGRLCEVGLFGPANDSGDRTTYRPLADELARQRPRFEIPDAARLPMGVVPLRRGSTP